MNHKEIVRKWIERKSIRSLEAMLEDLIDRMIELEEISFSQYEQEFTWSESGDNLDPFPKMVEV
jgi:hypothetical protein